MIYKSEKIRKTCTDTKAAAKLFGGEKKMAICLRARINALQQAVSINDIIAIPSFHFHPLQNKGRNLDGLFAIDVKSRKEPWRIILELLDENQKPFNPCHIDMIARYVKVVKIEEVSKHYEK